MEDTLRYFFSAVFQGFAAIITLGIMFYLYYLDRQAKKVDEIEAKLLTFAPDHLTKNFKEKQEYFINHGIVKYIDRYFIEPKIVSDQHHQIVILMKKHNSMTEKKRLLTEKLAILFNIARIILIISLISLFIIGYYLWLNIVLAFFGFTIIILSIIFFSKLFKFSKTIIEGPF